MPVELKEQVSAEMRLLDEFDWICIHTMDDRDKAYALEQVFYANKLPIQIREDGSQYAVWVPMKHKVLCADILENFLADNLATGFVRFEEPPRPEDKVVIGRAYERRAPARFYFLLMLLGLFLLFLRVIYGFDFL